MNSKMGNKDFYKGRGARNEGTHTTKGETKRGRKEPTSKSARDCALPAPGTHAHALTPCPTTLSPFPHLQARSSCARSASSPSSRRRHSRSVALSQLLPPLLPSLPPLPLSRPSFCCSSRSAPSLSSLCSSPHVQLKPYVHAMVPRPKRGERVPLLAGGTEVGSVGGGGSSGGQGGGKLQ